MHLKVGELASRSGLTVRTLHHFDQIGLLKPSARSDGGYRLYSRDDVARLHGIQALRHLGLPLKQIGEMLTGDGADLPAIVARQVRALDHEIRQANDLRGRLQLMLDRFDRGGQPELADWLGSLALMATYARYFNPDEIKTLVGNWRSIEAEWPALLAEVKAMMARGVPPTDLAMQPLAHRWMGLIHHWLGGDFDLIDRWGRMYGQEPGARQTPGPDLATVRYVEQATELRLAHWRKHCTMAELSRFGWVRHEEWQALTAAVRRLIADGVDPAAPAALAVQANALALLLRTADGDAALLHKLGSAVAADPVLRAGSALAPEVRAYMQQVRDATGLDTDVT